jgi:flavin-binding protein dodecin
MNNIVGLSGSSNTKALIENAVKRVQEEVPALERLKLVVALELHARGDTQHYRVEVPGPKVSKVVADDARVRIDVQRPEFNRLADAGIARWREAFEKGQVKASGPPEILQLIERVVARQEERGRTRRVSRG